jgi:DNA-binding transcriptional LysR family regulator
MEIGDLRYLVASADAGNFARAAIMLSRNASTLSRRVSRLENELGLPLFERSHSGVRLTSAGKAVLVHVRRALAEIDLSRWLATRAGPRLSVKFDLAFGCRRLEIRFQDSWRDGEKTIRASI